LHILYTKQMDFNREWQIASQHKIYLVPVLFDFQGELRLDTAQLYKYSTLFLSVFHLP